MFIDKKSLKSKNGKKDVTNLINNLSKNCASQDCHIWDIKNFFCQRKIALKFSMIGDIPVNLSTIVLTYKA